MLSPALIFKPPLVLAFADVEAGEVIPGTALKKTANAYWTGWSDVQISEQLADAVASGAFDKATLDKSPVDSLTTK